MHGAIYLSMKSSGRQRDRMISWINNTWIAYVVLYTVATFATFFVAPYLFRNMLGNLLFWFLFIVLFLSIIFIPVASRMKKFGLAFISSSVMIAMMIGLVALSLFPRLVPSSINLQSSLTIYNASSTPRTLTTMLIIALIGMPIVIGYTIFVYRVFRGTVLITKDSY
jgi:cytochrome d ubiquinol oxidase subunit II